MVLNQTTLLARIVHALLVYCEVPKLSTSPFGGDYLTLWHFNCGGKAK